MKFNPSYTGPRPDLLELVPNSAKLVLDVGCSNGAFGKDIKIKKPNAVVEGIELDSRMANEAKKVLNKTYIGNLQNMDFLAKIDKKYDLVVFGDVLEHTNKPKEILTHLVKNNLKKNGKVIISLPNIMFYTTFTNVYLKKTWPKNTRGIYDKTHLSWFTIRDAKEMVEDSGLETLKLIKKYRLFEEPVPRNRYAKIFNYLPGINNYFTHQVILVAKKC